ncbi:hypothetical protein Rleg5DRAFT_5129 [Rhizobium leguminosarum bv. viciae WSM1455]|nr:hypothetical protein Rleg5DRAFT_5129 [Rhizobium leguminosarum bv. viciae WSM1455]
MPWFGEVHYWDTNAIVDYSYPLNSNGIFGRPFGALSEEQRQPLSKLGKALVETPVTEHRYRDDKVLMADYEAEKFLQQAMLRYFYIFGLGEPDIAKVIKVCKPIVEFLTADRLHVAIMAPILMHQFDCKHFRLGPDAFIMKLSKNAQLSRAVASSWTYGVSKNVAACATHAFVSTGWTLKSLPGSQLFRRLNQPIDAVFEEIDRFFAAFRLMTDAISGYAQVLILPRHWVSTYSWDLPVMYGGEHRRYPTIYDKNYDEDDFVRTVPNDLLVEVKTAFGRISKNKQNNITLALRRLNQAMARDDDVDAILDAIIGIELLLGGDKSDSITFKLRMRAAGLAKLGNDIGPSETYRDLGKIYSTRSEIVHGSTKKATNKAAEVERQSKYREHRDLATIHLRLVLRALLEHPEYRDPVKIDNELLIGFPSLQDKQ